MSSKNIIIYSENDPHKPGVIANAIPHDYHKDESISNSIASSNISYTSDTSAVRELKMSLFERNYPQTVMMLKYAIWILVLVLLGICIIDWVISYNKINDNSDSLILITRTSLRFDLIGMASTYARTELLLVT